MRILVRVLLAFFALIVVSAGTGLLYWYWVPLHRGSYVAANQTLQASVGVPPGATLGAQAEQVLKPQNNAIFVLGPQRTIGYDLWSEYGLSTPMKLGAFLAFFNRRLAGWKGPDDVGKGSRPVPSWVKRGPQEWMRGDANFGVTAETSADGLVTGFTTTADAHDPYISYFSP